MSEETALSTEVAEMLLWAAEAIEYATTELVDADEEDIENSASKVKRMRELAAELAMDVLRLRYMGARNETGVSDSDSTEPSEAVAR